jgi:hypothetical protein
MREDDAVERRRPAPADAKASRVFAPVQGGSAGRCHVSRRGTPALLFLFLLFATSLSAQTDTVVAGVLGDASVIAPVVSWNRTAASGETLAVTLNGWTVSAEGTRRRAPRSRGVVSFAITPLNAHSSDRIYVDGVRARELEFDASSIEATFGRIDTLGDRWTSDVRAVALAERVDGTAENYAGLRARQSWHRITAEDPLLLTFEGFELSGTAEVFAGSHTWSRVRIDQRYSKRWGRVRAGESVVAFQGSSLDRASEFLVGGSWPVGELRPLYGYRYAELRLDRGVGINGDVSFALTRSLALGAHASVLRDARGFAADVSASWRGIGFRVGVAQAQDGEAIVYGSILAARFIR